MLCRSAGNMLLATYRCQEAMNRLEMTVRTVEGQYGDLQAMVLAKMEPKTAQSVRVSIKPLSLHHRLQGDIDDRPVNTLRITGSFTLGQMHEWVCFCLPDVPARTLDSEVNMAFRNVYLGSVLSAQYRYPLQGVAQGHGTQSHCTLTLTLHCASTCTDLQQGRSNLQVRLSVHDCHPEGGYHEAGYRSQGTTFAEQASKAVTLVCWLVHTGHNVCGRFQISVNLPFEIKDETVPNFLRLIHPKLTYTLSLARKVDLIEALKEIKIQDTDMTFLAPEYSEVRHVCVCVMVLVAQPPGAFVSDPPALQAGHGARREVPAGVQEPTPCSGDAVRPSH